MLKVSTIAFLRDLGKNNSKAWVDEHRDRWDSARQNFIEIAETVIELSHRVDTAIPVTRLDPQRCFTRLNRDPRTRYGRPPYKTELDIFANPGDTMTQLGYYVHVEPGNCYAGASLFIPSAAALAQMRTKIAAQPRAWFAIIEDTTFKASFPHGVEAMYALKKMPRGYDESHPAAHYLKMKGCGTKSALTHADLQGPDAEKKLAALFRATKPLCEFFNEKRKTA